jgi:glycosyltransferase involved in cell wall biosynthesis
MDNNPVVSVITRTKNRPLTLKRLAENLKEQKFENFEWIIINDCGEPEGVDEIAERAKKNIDVKVIHNTTPNGRSYPVNLGADSAAGEYLLIIDDDDYLHEDCLADMVKFLKKNKNYQGVSGKTQVIIEEIHSNGNIEKIKTGHLYSPAAKDFRCENIFFSNPTPVHGTMIKKTCFIAAGGFPTDIEYTEDWCFWFKFSLNYQIGTIEKTLAYYSQRKTIKNDYQNSAAYNKEGDRLHRIHEAKWKKKLLKQLDRKHLIAIVNNPKWKTVDHSIFDVEKLSSYYSMKNKDKVIRLIPDNILKIFDKICFKCERMRIYQNIVKRMQRRKTK